LPKNLRGRPLAKGQEVDRRTLALVCAFLLAACRAAAQDAPAHHHHEDKDPGWTWMADANLIFGFNDQQRKLTPFQSWESQNWAMLSGLHRAGRGTITILGMVSLEPFTIPAEGSPQLFQTGESYKQVPLVNYQHPHDLVMALGATYQVTKGDVTVTAGADLVGSPTLGPTAFMHRESARDNPQVPLTHHWLDSTHITPGVLRGGVGYRGFVLEASAFRGAEPDDNRLNIERPRIDSWAVRLGWTQGPWSAQVSGGFLKQPEWFEPYDVTRITASLSYDGTIKSKPVAATVAWGGNREFNGFNGNNDGYLAEGRIRATDVSTVYGRVEGADKELFGLGLHPRGFSHRHTYFRVYAFTAGYIRDLPVVRWGRLGIGADATTYTMPPDLLPFYDGSHSFHLFVRWRPAARMAHAH
jgi:hypothetical protein